MKDKNNLLSNIPSVDELMREKDIERLTSAYHRAAVVEGIREYLKDYRRLLLSLEEEENPAEISSPDMIKGIIEKVNDMMRNNLVNVVNATGVVLHTNLGRSPLAESAMNAILDIAPRYSNLEMDLESGDRGSRYSHVEELICRLTGAQAAMVVNNNAAAVMLVLSTMAKGREVVVSRGQLVEIGGSFRVPDVMEQSGVTLVEIGTTNKTHVSDYEKAVNENTAAFMKVHTSNYRILGFTSQVESEDMVALGRRLGLPVIEDLGSGMLMDLTEFGLPYEPTVQKAIKAGMDVVTFSGDKMLGGPQAGIIAGSRKYIDSMKKNPLTRAVRIDKLTLAALEGTLRLYSDRELALAQIPVLRMLTFNMEELGKRAKRLSLRLRKTLGTMADVNIADEFSEVGGGSMPLHKMPTKAVLIKPDSVSLTELEEMLRKYKTPVIARISRDRLILDVRTIMDDEYETVEGALQWAFSALSKSSAAGGSGKA
ncbi:MAG TPA: L-seryl-tRNA(Sec) selenium transferase [Bacillota bacterium]|nr:L-seryl-tRNA(Sec) selenium transferase [Bacillota bacterium]